MRGIGLKFRFAAGPAQTIAVGQVIGVTLAAARPEAENM
jgi:hypothetical protein